MVMKSAILVWHSSPYTNLNTNPRARGKDQILSFILVHYSGKIIISNENDKIRLI